VSRQLAWINEQTIVAFHQGSEKSLSDRGPHTTSILVTVHSPYAYGHIGYVSHDFARLGQSDISAFDNATITSLQTAGDDRVLLTTSHGECHLWQINLTMRTIVRIFDFEAPTGTIWGAARRTLIRKKLGIAARWLKTT
jgi:hypothetical protein